MVRSLKRVSFRVQCVDEQCVNNFIKFIRSEIFCVCVKKGLLARQFY